MTGWMQLLAIVGAGLLVWLAFRLLKGNPTMFSKENVENSFVTIGILTLLLIAVIAVCIFILKHT